ncbi:DUF397 domain-containing protein [Nonomuraea lactucae]|uniref:DUF397 domain-containing protein n=1 Tax=Nonomuraea lactucae TaxID=2249762 RepID=UPI000DE23932|nr:DUF397 domain-containing protein [Nonomuraea lactucae]
MGEEQPLVWRKSSYSTEQDLGTCVEVAELGDRLGVRDSKNPSQPHLTFSRQSWSTFIGAIRSGSV